MLFQVLCGFEPIFYTTHPNEEPYLFVEKIAFEQPYQATKVNNMDELLSILSLRPEYFGEEKEAGPFVYNNGDYVGTLELQSAEL